MIQFQILQTNIIWIVWQAVMRITNEILGVNGLINFYAVYMKALTNMGHILEAGGSSFDKGM